MNRKEVGRAAAPVVETLECRRMMAASPLPAAVKGGFLTLTGTAGDDTITVAPHPTATDQLLVTVNDNQFTFARAKLRGVRADGRTGNDWIGVDPTAGPLGLPVTVVGGAGNDTLVGGESHDFLNGGAGNDRLDGAAGNDRLTPGAGLDTVVSAAGSDKLAKARTATVFRTHQDAPPIQAPWDRKEVVTEPAGDDQQPPAKPVAEPTSEPTPPPAVYPQPQPQDQPPIPEPTVIEQPPVPPTSQVQEPQSPQEPQPPSVDRAFPMYDATLYVDKPDLTSAKLQPIMVSGQDFYAGVWPNLDYSKPDEAATRTLARRVAAAGTPLVLDIETLPVDIRLAPVDQVEASISFITQIIEWVRSERPSVKVGVYGILPLTDYTTPVLYKTALEQPEHGWFVTNLARLRGDYEAWQIANDALTALANKVDVVFPSLYTFHDNPADWVRYAEANIAEARRYGKPVVPFLWMRYHESNTTIGTQMIDASFWKLQLDTVHALADGAVIWGGYNVKTGRGENWDENAPWWPVTRDFAVLHASEPTTVSSLDIRPSGRKATDLLQAETHDEHFHAGVFSDAVGGHSGGWLKLAGIDFGPGVDQFAARLAVTDEFAGGTIELRLDGLNGPAIGALKVTSTGAWHVMGVQSTAVRATNGIHDLYVLFKGTSAVATVDWFRFGSSL